MQKKQKKNGTKIMPPAMQTAIFLDRKIMECGAA